MKTYSYTGPLSGVSLKECGDVLLIPGSTVQLPADNGYTQRLIRKGWLQEEQGQGSSGKGQGGLEAGTDPDPETSRPETKKRRK
jgi:hypothetical protein